MKDFTEKEDYGFTTYEPCKFKNCVVIGFNIEPTEDDQMVFGAEGIILRINKDGKILLNDILIKKDDPEFVKKIKENIYKAGFKVFGSEK